MSTTSFPYGTLTRPFPPNPVSFVPKTPEKSRHSYGYSGDQPKDSLPEEAEATALHVVANVGKENDAARQKKEHEIRELQAANKSLLQRVSSSHSISQSARGQGQGQGQVQASSGRPSQTAATALIKGYAEKGAGGTAAATGPSTALGLGPQAESLAAYLPAAIWSSVSEPSRSRTQPQPQRQQQEGDLELPVQASAGSLKGLLGLVQKASGLQEEVLELQRALKEQQWELDVQRAQTERTSEALLAAEAKHSELRDEQASAHSMRTLLELQGAEGASYKTIRNYIDGDLAAMRAERRDAEALLRAEAKRWHEAAERFEAEWRSAALSQEASLERQDALRAEQRTTRIVAEEAAVLTDEATEQRMLRAKSQVESAESAAASLRQHLEACSEVAAQASEQARRSEAAVRAHQVQRNELVEQLEESERFGEEQLGLLQQLQSRFEVHEHEVEARELAATDEKKRLRRDATKKVAEYQAWGSELRGEAEESAAKSREAERGLHAKLSSLRQERQRVETKLRAQLQSVQEELQTERASRQESREILDCWGDLQEELSSLRGEGLAAESECGALRAQQVQTAARLQRRNEQLQEELRAVCEEAKLAAQSEVLEERGRYVEEAWQRLSAVEERHCQQVAQLQDAQDTELGFISDQGRHIARRLEQQLEQLESNAAAQALLLEAESAQVEALSSGRETLRAELNEARADADGALEEHEALLQVLRREHEAADVHFQQLLLQAEERQRKLGRLQGDCALAPPSAPGLLDDILEESSRGHPHTHGQGQASARSATTRCSTALSKALPSPLFAHSDAFSVSPRSSACGGSSARGTWEGDGVDGVLRSLQHERELRRAQRLGDEFTKALAQAEADAHVGGSNGNSRPKHKPTLHLGADAAVSPRHLELETCRSLFSELLLLYEQALQVNAEDTLRFTALHEKEAVLRAQLKRADVRQASLRRMEMHGHEHETELGQLEAALEQARCLSQEEARAKYELHGELKTLQGELGHRLAEAEALSQQELREAAGGAAATEAQLSSAAASARKAFQEHGELLVQLEEVRQEHAEVRQEHVEVRQEHTQAQANSTAAHALAEAAHLQHKNEWLVERESLQQAHRDERGLLIAEIQQFQKEKYAMDEKLRWNRENVPRLEAELADAKTALAKSTVERKQAETHLRALELDEVECMQLRQGAESHLAEQLEEKLQAVQRAKEQLHAVREERNREKHRHEKQLDRFRGRIEVLEHREAALERRSEQSDRQESRCLEELAQRLDQGRRETRQVGARLQEAQLEEQSGARQLEAAELRLQECSASLASCEAACRELLSERDHAESCEAALCHEHGNLEATLASQQEALLSAQGRLQELEEGGAPQEGSQHSGGPGRGHETPGLELEQLRSAIASECRQALQVLPAADADEVVEMLRLGPGMSAAVIVRTLRALARQATAIQAAGAGPVAGAGAGAVTTGTVGVVGVGVDAPGGGAGGSRPSADQAARLATLQKELIKLREQNQELLHEKRLQEQRSLADQTGSAAAAGPPAAGRGASTTEAAGSRAASSSTGGPENVYMRHQLKQLQQAKVKAEAQRDELKTELQEQTSALQAEVERLKALHLEEKRCRDSDHVQAQKRNLMLEQKFQALGVKLQEHTEAHHQLLTEKESLEQQLAVATQQLESLLDEQKEGDLQGDLASLSRQLEQLHSQHRLQLADAAERAEALQKQEACQSKLEAELQQESQKVTLLRQQESALEADLRTTQSELSTSASDASQLRSWQRQQTAAAQALEDQLQQLQEELLQARENNPRAREAVRHLQQKDAELEVLREELEAAEVARQRLQAEARLRASELAELTRPQGAAAAREGTPFVASHAEPGGRHATGARSYERHGGSKEEQPPQVLVRTVEDGKAERGATLDSILTMLDSREIGLSHHKSLADINTTGVQHQRPQQVDVGEGQTDSGSAASAHVMAPSLEEAEKEFGQVARSLGFNGDIESLWEEAKARAAILEAKGEGAADRDVDNTEQNKHATQAASRQHRMQTFDDLPVQGPPIAADVDLSTVGRKVVRGYPESPPAASPLSTLLASTQKSFQQAEALCEQQRFAEAVPLFQQVLQAIERGQEVHAPAGFVAEVWAHMGVAVQSLDQVPEAVRCYKKALAHDPTLHVCFANLATLHGYLRDTPSALEYIRQALALDPKNETYLQIKSQLDEASGRGAQSSSSGSGRDHGGKTGDIDEVREPLASDDGDRT